MGPLILSASLSVSDEQPGIPPHATRTEAARTVAGSKEHIDCLLEKILSNRECGMSATASAPSGAWVPGRDRPGQGRTRDGVTRAGRRRPTADHLPDGLRLSSSSTKPVHSEMVAPSRIRSPSSLIPAGSMNITPARFRRRPLGGVCSSTQTRRSSSTQGPRSLPSSLSVGIESLAPSSTRVIFSTAGSHANNPTSTTNTPSRNCTRGAKPPHRKIASSEIPTKKRLEVIARRGPGLTAREGMGDRCHEISGPLRGFVGRARDAELLEPAAEGVGMEAQDLGRAARPIDDPVRLAEDSHDMAALDCFEGGDRGISCRDGGTGGQLGVDLEVEGGAGREDDGALEHVLQLADITGPSIGDEA